MQIRNKSLAGFILWFQGIYTFLTATWALVHIRSFMWVSGYKTDIWLVKTVSVILISISISMMIAAALKRYSYEIISLCITSAIGLATVEFYYSTKDVISPVYALDGCLQILFIIGWIFSSKFSSK